VSGSSGGGEAGKPDKAGTEKRNGSARRAQKKERLGAGRIGKNGWTKQGKSAKKKSPFWLGHSTTEITRPTSKGDLSL